MEEDFETAKRLYNNQTKEYNNAQERNRRVHGLRTIIYDLLGDIKGKRILFTGCGSGLECSLAIKKGAKITGIDASESFIDFARKQFPGEDFRVMDFGKTNFEDYEFDAIVSINSVMYKENIVPTLNEWRRIMDITGAIYLLVPHPVRKMKLYNEGNYFVKGKQWEEWRGTKRFNYYRLIEDYITDFTSSGLKVVKLIEPEPIKNKGDTTEDLNHPHSVIFKLKKG